MGSEPLVWITSCALMVMLRLAVTLWVGDSESVTLAVKLKVPAVVGVPVIAPVLVLRLSPGGKLPVLLQVKGVMPPVAVRLWL